jgi:uncharacterized protein (DUF608 family)
MMPWFDNRTAGAAFPRTEATRACGLPLGGLGTGHVELNTRGRLGTAGMTNNWNRLLDGMRGTFFALRAGTPGCAMPAFALLQEGDQAGFAGVTRVRFRARMPVAEVEYILAGLPLHITLTAFSPLVPHEVDRSGVPGAVFTFTLRNRGTEPLEAALAFSWEHILGCGGGGAEGAELHCNRTGNTIHPWSGAAGRGLRFRSVLPPEPGPERNRHGECVLALAGDGGLRPFAMQNWNVLTDEADVLRLLSVGRLAPRFAGYYLDALGPPPAAGDNTRGQKTGEPGEVDPYDVGGHAGLEGTRHPAGLLGAEFTLEPDARQHLRFVLAWHTPHHYVIGRPETDWGHAYQDRFADAGAAADYLLERADTEQAASRELAAFLDGSDLPGWLADKLLNDTVTLTTNTVVSRDGRLATLEGTESMWGSLGTLDQRLVSHPGTSLFYPDLNRTELRTFADLQGDDGAISHFTGNVHSGMRDTSVRYGVTHWPDLSCSFIIQCYLDLVQTGETGFFDTMLPAIRRAFAWLRQADRDGDGIPEGGSSWDVEHYEQDGFVVTATLYLAALRVLEAIGEHQQDAALSAEAREAFEPAAATVQGMWNGRYYNKCVSRQTGRVSTDLHSGQLEGEWVVRQLGLPGVLPPGNVQRALRTFYGLLHDRDRYTLAPMQTDAEGRLRPGRLLAQAWPQYTMVFTDCLALLSGLVEPAMASIRHFDRVVRDIVRCPWGTTLWHDARTGLPAMPEHGFDHYMNGPAAWWVLSALTGFMSNELRQRLVLGPVALPGRDGGGGTRYPAVSPRYWAEIGLEPGRNGGERRITFVPRRFFRGDTIRLREIRLRGEVAAAAVELDGRATAAALQPAGLYTDLLLEETAELTTGTALSITTRPA